MAEEHLAAEPERLPAREARACRVAWKRLDEASRERLAARLEADGTLIACTWLAVLRRAHPLADWLDGEEPVEVLVGRLERGPGLELLLQRHPFGG